MWETCSVHLEVHLPREIAAAAAEVQKSDPEFLSRVVAYGITRRAIFEHLRDRPRVSALEGRGADPSQPDNP